jgi:hypothetical protein
VASLLEGSGFEVIDLGADVPPEKFIEAVREHWSLHKSHLISRYRVKIGIKLHEVIVCRSDNAINRRKTLRKPHGNHQ